MLHAVETCGLDHRVVSHVVKDQLISDRERTVKCVVTDHVSSKAGDPPEAVAVWALLSRGLVIEGDLWAVGHFEDVGHVGGG